jgi:succinyl-diaminopimelate desuccinylase
MTELSLKLLSDLVSFKTITPVGEDAIDYCSSFLKKLGFVCKKLKFERVCNLYAKFGQFSENLCFAGHVDVVPPIGDWDTNPFTLIQKNGKLYGRGTNDMKGPLAACLSAIYDFISNNSPHISISVLLTSDEEIMGSNGTKSVVEYLKSTDEKIDCCVLCESCSPGLAGEYIKIGCRGSLNVNLTSNGIQCHVVNGREIGNHLHNFVKILTTLTRESLDSKISAVFPQSTIELTSIDVDNNVRNVIPPLATAKLNIRFNDNWDFEGLERYLLSILPDNIKASFERFSLPFIGASQKFISFLAECISEAIKVTSTIGTLGGASDAIFLKEITDVVEIGSSVIGAHISNEYITNDDITKLEKIYLKIMKNFNNNFTK